MSNAHILQLIEFTMTDRKYNQFMKGKKARPPGIPVREFPGIPGNRGPQNSRREFPGISEILAGITGNFASFVFFLFLIVDYDILVFNLSAFLSKTLNDVFDPTFCV